MRELAKELDGLFCLNWKKVFVLKQWNGMEWAIPVGMCLDFDGMEWLIPFHCL